MSLESPRLPPLLCFTPVAAAAHLTPSGLHLTGLRCQPKPPAQPHAASPTRSASPTWQVAAGSVLSSVQCPLDPCNALATRLATP
eukprot:scaffold125955_cov69-Phaeocystis_antarctica.AAC.1